MKIPALVWSIFGALFLWLCWPPFATGFLLPFGFVPWLLLVERLAKIGKIHRAKWYLMLGVFIWNFLCTWWVWYASPEGAVFMLCANTLLMTMFWGFYLWARRKREGVWAYLTLIGSWITFEFMHLNWDGNFPWLNLGNGFSANPKLIQWYEFTGTLGGSLWVLTCSILVLVVLKNRSRRNTIILSFCYFLPILLSLYMYGTYQEKGEQKEVVIIQPNLDPYKEKFNINAVDISNLMVDLAKEKLTDSTKLLLLPETALPGWMVETHITNQRKVRVLLDIFHDYPNLSIVTGAETYEYLYADKRPTPTAKHEEKDVYYDAYNTAILFERHKKPILYHKSKLVPGPEKVPYIGLFHFLENFHISIPGSAGSLGISKEPIVLKTKNGISLAPLICYESVFGEYTGEFVQKGANVLAIITNDAWWASSNGHKHHFLYGAVRAIETRKDIARSGNTGISAFINQKGEVRDRGPWWEPYTLKGFVRTNETVTLYVLLGDYLGWAGLILLMVCIVKRFLPKSS